MLRIFPTDLPAGPVHLDLHRVRVVLTYGSITYLDSDAATPQITKAGDLRIDASEVEKQSRPGAHLLVILPFKVDGEEANEREIRNRISDVVGLMVAINDRNMAYEHMFDYVHDVEGNERSVIGQTLLNPMAIPKPDISRTRLDLIGNLDSIVQSFPGRTRNRVRLSLRWYEQGLRDTGVDAFLKFWIAIETLAMPDTTNIRPTIEALAEVYDLSPEEAAQKYQIGRLFGLRSKIVHDGRQVPVPGSTIDYIEAVYTDLLMQHLGRPSFRRVERQIEGGFNPLDRLSRL